MSVITGLDLRRYSVLVAINNPNRSKFAADEGQQVYVQEEGRRRNPNKAHRNLKPAKLLRLKTPAGSHDLTDMFSLHLLSWIAGIERHPGL